MILSGRSRLSTVPAIRLRYSAGPRTVFLAAKSIPACSELISYRIKKTAPTHGPADSFCACVKPRQPQCSFVNGKNGHKGAGGPHEFVTTRWSLILSAANVTNEEQKARDALAELCRTYWRPVFSFVCRRGYSTEDAQD